MNSTNGQNRLNIFRLATRNMNSTNGQNRLNIFRLATRNMNNTPEAKPEAKEGPLEEDGDHESRGKNAHRKFDNEIIYARFLCNNIQGNNRVQKA